MLSIGPTSLRILTIACLLIAWEASTISGLAPKIIVAPLSEIVSWGVGHWAAVSSHLQLTLFEMGLAVLFTWPLGVVVGMLVGIKKYLYDVFTPLLTAAFAIPLIIFYELFTVWVGIGAESKIIFAVSYGFFPIALNTVVGLKNIDREYVLLAKSVGANTAQTLYKVILPLALPSIVAGLRIGTALIVVGVLVTEMLASYAGMGFLIARYYELLATSAVYFVVFLSILIVVAVNAVLGRVEKGLNKWRKL